jgi:oligopeptide/dipeptide ABC transporter ATP-binding protein
MQQRVAIAMALVCRPALLILDEPTTALDVTIEAQILELIKSLRDEFAMSVLLITHDLGIVAQTCDRVAVMYAGNVVEFANVTELFEKPLHPYTAALLRAIVSPDRTADLEVITGSVPDLMRPPDGCRFHPRCPFAMDICRKKKPPTTGARSGHKVACYLYPEEPT